MKAVTWHGRRDVRVDNVPDPRIEEPTDAIIRVTTTGLCGSDLHLYELLGPFMDAGDILGHEPMGEVVEVGADVHNIAPGDRVVVPFNISCGHCFMCGSGLQSQCETTQVQSEGKGAALLGYSKMYGQVAGGQAEYLRVPQAHYGPVVIPEEIADDRAVYLSDVLPTAYQAVQYADIPKGGSVVVLGLGPIGDMAARVAMLQGAERVIGVDLVPERVARGQAFGYEAVDLRQTDDLVARLREMTGGRGPDAVIDAVGMEAHGAPIAKAMQTMTSFLPDAISSRLMERAGVDRLTALHVAIDTVRRGGTISVVGVYGGMADPLPMMTLFDKQIQLRMGQANVRRWTEDLMPWVMDAADPLGLATFATHRLPLDQAPRAYEMFQHKTDGAVKVLFQP